MDTADQGMTHVPEKQTKEMTVVVALIIAGYPIRLGAYRYRKFGFAL